MSPGADHDERDRAGPPRDQTRTRSTLFATASLALVAVLFLLEKGEGSAFLRAAAVNLAVVTWSSFVLPLRGLPPFESYFQLRPWERSGRLYHLLGVSAFRVLVRRGPLSVFNRALPAAWRTGDPGRIEHELRAAEAGHAIAFAIVLALAVLAIVRGDRARAAWLIALDLPMNLYPTLLQRDHRAWLMRERSAARE